MLLSEFINREETTQMYQSVHLIKLPIPLWYLYPDMGAYGITVRLHEE
jgi:hypothetical protein